MIRNALIATHFKLYHDIPCTSREFTVFGMYSSVLSILYKQIPVKVGFKRTNGAWNK